MDSRNRQDYELGWDDEISEDLEPFQPLPDGDYEFEVVGFQRGRFNGSEKMPACPQAILKLRVYDGEMLETTITHRLNLRKRSERFISAFFVSIGLKKPGERCRMQWNRVVGTKGRCRIGSRVYNGTTYNEVREFYPPDGVMKEQPAQPSGFTPGQF